MTKLLIVESPGKIKKLKGILGPDWDVKASMGHIRQLSNEGADKLGFRFDSDRIICSYQAKDDRSKQTIASLRSAVNSAQEVFLASDPDREGETIAWHIADELKLQNPQRVVYQEITKKAVLKAVANPRPMNEPLVDAGRCRDCLDKLVGYKGSPLVWRLNNGAKSMGRVQSAALRIVCDREQAIQAFQPLDYWSVWSEYSDGLKGLYNGGGSDDTDDDRAFNDAGERLGSNESTRVLSQQEADALVETARNNPHKVIDISGKVTSKKPPAPFTTSSLQQVAGSKLGFDPERTMSLAQKLYESGLITYMRTDSVSLSEDFQQASKTWLESKDPDNVPESVAKQKKADNAQEAHEAVRPTNLDLSSAELKQKLPADEFDLYRLIWMRSIASQCKPAKIRKTVILIESCGVQWKAKGSIVEFKGYSKYWQDITGDCVLPKLEVGQELTLTNAQHEAKQTKPPARYSEPKLVQVMEKKGVGRPSTYASTIKTLKDRVYVTIDKKKMVPSQRGLEVDALLCQALPDLIQADFTAGMESKLDEIAKGAVDWEEYLTGWNQGYFAPALKKALAALPAQESTREKSEQCCPSCRKPMSKIPSQKIKVGGFLKCENGCKEEGGDRDLVMFWSERQGAWEVPKKKVPGKLTNHKCPVCDSMLELYEYEKNGAKKTMLRCSKSWRDKKTHDGAVYFHSQGRWWSPKFGELEVARALPVPEVVAPTEIPLSGTFDQGVV